MSGRLPWLLGLLACGSPVPGAAPIETSSTSMSPGRVVVAAEGSTLWSAAADGRVFRGPLDGGEAIASLPGAPSAIAVVGDELIACVPDKGLYRVTKAGVQHWVGHLPSKGTLSLDEAKHGGDHAVPFASCVAVAVSVDAQRVYLAQSDAIWLFDRGAGVLSSVDAKVSDVRALTLDLHPGGLRETSLIVAEGKGLARVGLLTPSKEPLARTVRPATEITRDPQGRLWTLLPSPSQWWTPVASTLGMADDLALAVYDWRGEELLATVSLPSGSTSLAVIDDELRTVGSTAVRAQVEDVLSAR